MSPDIGSREDGSDGADLGALSAVLESLLEREVLQLSPASGGGNNRIFRGELADGPVAVKLYHVAADGGHLQRLNRETRSLRWLQERGISTIPALRASSERHGLAVFDWVSGSQFGTPLPPHDRMAAIAAIGDFLASLHRASRYPPPVIWNAQEACLSAAELIRQIDQRRLQLYALDDGEPALGAFIAQAFDPVFRLAQNRLDSAYRQAGLPGDREIPESARSFSPSDFGYHNALRAADGRLVFVDFEYAGWDDPVKLTSDFLWHPAMRLSSEERVAYLETAHGLYGHSHGFGTRLAAQYPLYGLRWCLILLNEFLPDRWRRRKFAAAGRPGAGELSEEQWRAAKLRQLDRAQAYLRAASIIVETPARAGFASEAAPI